MSRPTVAECARLLTASSGKELAALLDSLAEDPRAGIQDACRRARIREGLRISEEQRLDDLARLEAQLHSEGYAAVAGVDEVGRGALAGPVTAAAVILVPGVRIIGLDDSKRLRPAARAELSAEIQARARATAVAHVPAHIIDALGIAPATRRAMEIALSRLDPAPDHAVTDGLLVGLSLPETPVIGGDATVAAIAAASIIAKVARDTLMANLSLHYRSWDFEVNRGYGTPEHLASIKAHGLTPLHRRSFSPCAAHLTLF